MENPKKVIGAFLCIAFLFSCKTDKKELSSTAPKQQEFTQIGPQLYKDTAQNIYLKVKNKPVLHPSKKIENIPDSIYISTIVESQTNTEKKLKGIIDTNSFEKVNEAGNYFKDKNWTYVYENNTKTVPFYFLANKKITFFGKKNDYMTINGNVYYLGTKLEGVNSESRSLIYLSSETKEYEMYVDENNLYYDGIQLDSERIKYLDISQKKKDSISAIYFNKN